MPASARYVDWIHVASVALLGAVVLMPAITSFEDVTFRVGNIQMNLRVAAYFTTSLTACVAAAAVLVRSKWYPAWLKAMVLMLVWLWITALVSGQSPIEWLPTIVRFVLYFSAAVVFCHVGRGIGSSEEARVWSLAVFWTLLVAALVPGLAGLMEWIRGMAPLLNGAPRISGSMPTHPVAYSLVLVVSALATMGIAIVRGRTLLAALLWALAASVTALVFMTFTRLSILLLAGGVVALAILLPAPRRTRGIRLATAIAISASVVLLALPTFDARFTYMTPLSTVMSRIGSTDPDGSRTPDPESSTNPQPSGKPAGGQPIDISVDGSAAYRILLTERGLEYVARSPLFGNGPGSFDRLYQAETGRSSVAAHNDLMAMAVGSGVPGLIVYILVLAAVVWSMWPRGSIGVVEADALATVALVTFVGINIGATIHNPNYFVEIELPVWIMAGLAVGLRSNGKLHRVSMLSQAEAK